MYKFSQKQIDDALSYTEFRAHTEKILTSDNKPAPYNKEAYVQYTEVNHQRTEKLLRNIQIDKKLYNALNEGINDWTWVLINEPWCSDGSFSQPVIEAMALASGGNINFKIILRDSNLDIMNAYLTNGGQAIPKMVCLDKNLNELGTWGPRPQELQEAFLEWKKDDSFDLNEKIKKVNRWYLKDKGQTIQKEFIDLIKEWKKTQDAE